MSDKQTTMAGHPAAVKAGGMRITQSKPHEEPKPKKDEKEEGEEGEQEEQATGDAASSAKSERHQQQLLLQGVVTKGDKDFPPEAIKAYHDKPTAKVDKHSHQDKHSQHNIQQPRK